MAVFAFITSLVFAASIALFCAWLNLGIKESKLFDLKDKYKKIYYHKYKKRSLLGFVLQALPHPIINFGLGYDYAGRTDLMMIHNMTYHFLPMFYSGHLYSSIKILEPKATIVKINGNFDMETLKNFKYPDYHNTLFNNTILIKLLQAAWIVGKMHSYYYVNHLIKTYNNNLYSSLFKPTKMSYQIFPTPNSVYINLSYNF